WLLDNRARGRSVGALANCAIDLALEVVADGWGWRSGWLLPGDSYGGGGGNGGGDIIVALSMVVMMVLMALEVLGSLLRGSSGLVDSDLLDVDWTSEVERKLICCVSTL